METKWYQVEIKGTTYRSYNIKAESVTKATQMALGAVDEDWEIEEEWKRNAEVDSCQRLIRDDDENLTTDTSHLNNEEFGNYIKDNCK
jgi:hypothetical protein